jgi:ATP synthase protein I
MSNMYKNLALVSYIGISMTLPILGGLFLGKFLDDKFNSGNLFLLGFIIIGVIISFLNLYKIAMGATRRK